MDTVSTGEILTAICSITQDELAIKLGEGRALESL